MKFNFSSEALAVSLEQPIDGEPLEHQVLPEFAHQAEVLSGIVRDQLGLRDFSRMGVRVQYLFAFDTTADAMAWLSSLKVFSVDETFSKAFGKLSLGAQLVVRIEGEDRHYRVELKTIERAVPVDVGDAILNVRAHQLHVGQRDHLLKQRKVKKALERNPQHCAMIDIDVYHEDPQFVRAGEFVESSFEEVTVRLGKAFSND